VVNPLKFKEKNRIAVKTVAVREMRQERTRGGGVAVVENDTGQDRRTRQ
jgi:hypothetical protein